MIIDNIDYILAKAAAIAWSPFTLCFILGTSIFLTFRLKFIQFHYLKKAFQQILYPEPQGDSQEQISPMHALATILSSTIGTGNIAGVATAMVTGGPGALFWMWITAIFGMATKFASCVLANRYREVAPDSGEVMGGPMFTMQNALNMPVMGVIFSLCCIFASFTTGALVQSNSLIDGVGYIIPAVHEHYLISGCVLALLTGVVIVGGISRLANVAVVLVPFMALFYCSGAIAILIINYQKIPQAFYIIINHALNFQAFGGAAIGSAIQHGMSRGMMASEAGLGTAPIALAAAEVKHPAEAGLIAMVGPIFDTLLVCSMTGLVLVLADYQSAPSYLQGTALASFAFQNGLAQLHPQLGIVGSWVVGIGVVLFAYTSMIAWPYFGSRSLQYLKLPQLILPFQAMYLLAIILGAVTPLNIVWHVVDLGNLGMAIPNLISLLLLSTVTARMWREYQQKK